MTPPPVDLDDFDLILGSEDATLPASLPVPSSGNGKSGTPASFVVDDEADGWLGEPLPAKLDKIRALFFNSKTPTEVYNAASLMPIGDWLEMVVKLSPKNVQVTGDISFIHMLDALGPIDKGAYRLPAPVECVVEAELAE